ncbi:quinoprotein amine dehydrogenase [Duganella sp. SAP-35]|uniref:Quinoprotein amine dehydrogenase n=1 Tax=Duganella aceris TaxID=2703883 RepID=A0ABX0FBL6_9BURK|nr:quinoprotein amine dehydrogenase [Duganella aceris]
MIAALLTACGGGGGGNNGGTPTTPAVSPALSFTPSTVTASIPAGTSQTLSVIASVARPADFANAGTVYATVTDSVGVILPSAQLIRDSDTQYHAVLQSAPTLVAGNYKGSFTVRLCRDSGCANQFPGSPMTLPYDLTVQPAGQASFSAVSAMPLSATTQQGGAAPARSAVTISAPGRSWTVSNGGASWLKLDAAGGSGNATLGVGYDATGLAVGSYSTTLTVLAGDGLSVALPVTLTVLPSGLVLGSNSVTFNAINGAPIPSQIVSLDTDNKLSATWTAGSNVPWLSVSPTVGTTPATTVLTVDATVGKLASGSYSGAISIAPKDLPLRTLPVTLNLIPATLQASSNSITLGGVYGRDFGTAQTLGLGLNTATNSWPWTLGNLPAWATASVTAGTINQAGASSAIKALPSAAPAGVTSVLLNASAQVNGDVVNAPVLLTINKDAHRLLPAEAAVAFVSTPTWSRLTRTISVADNFGAFSGMTAVSDQSWLVVGVNGNQLILTADPTQMLDDTLQTGTITVTSSATDGAAIAPIRVSLWKGSAAPGAKVAVPLPYTTVVTDPARPYAYAHNGGAVIDVYNLYTGQKEASMTGFSAHLGDMAAGLNGDFLYMVDVDNARITTVDLRTRAISAQLPLATPGTRATRLKVVRPNGVEVLLMSDGQAFLTSSNSPLASLPLSGGGALGASADGKRVVQQSEAGATVQHTTILLDYAALNGGTLYSPKSAAASHLSPGTQGQDIAVSADGSRIYSASATPKLCSVMSSADLGVSSYLAIGDAAPNNIEVGLDGRIFCGGAAKPAGSDIWMYNATGATLLQQFKLSSTGKQLLPRQMALSSDGWLLVAITEDGVLTIVPVGP